jgi:DNA-binding MarR family transcriptional regulator
MNRTVNCLEETGYVTRETDPVDKRKISVAITESGTAVVGDTVKKRDAWLSAELETLSADERDVLARAAEIMAVIATR